MTRFTKDELVLVTTPEPDGITGFEWVVRTTGEIVARGRGFITPAYRKLAAEIALTRLTGERA